jgi:osmotically-inducible protein OsmY
MHKRLRSLTFVIALSAPALALAQTTAADRERSREDQRIAEQISDEIRGSVHYDVFDWVEGRVDDGVVTLRGAVRLPYRKEQFERVAREVPGVKEVRNEIRVLPASFNDDRLRVQTARIIYGDPAFTRYAVGYDRPVHIIVENGRITLKGTVGSQLDKQLMEAKVRSATLAFGVQNDLQIEGAERASREK